MLIEPGFHRVVRDIHGNSTAHPSGEIFLTEGSRVLCLGSKYVRGGNGTRFDIDAKGNTVWLLYESVRPETKLEATEALLLGEW